MFARFLFLALSIQLLCGLSNGYAQTDNSPGVQPLFELQDQSIHNFIPATFQPLISPKEIEQFLQKLEGTPPDWAQLRHHDMATQSEQLFQVNRQRDTARLAKDMVRQQPVAFIWAGLLRQYLPEFKGFSLALGPELTPTSWGIIRFKPIDLPNVLVAVPSAALRNQLLARQRNEESIEIIVVCMGTLISDESLIYGFSHDGHQDGMILPVVSIQKVMYLFKPL
jgi:hypothetical protein